ncbi:MAG TPA: hypothetical protein VFC78_22265 [Tepidisphaeraceae bacterium]|nr:hypothetical protein [Tepidisphaeraceae bacterium]
MTTRTLQINGRKFRIVPEKEYKTLRAAMHEQRRQAAEDAADLAQARRRLRDSKQKTISVARLKAELGILNDMRYTVEIETKAAREIRTLPNQEQRRIIAKIEALTNDPRPPG